MPLSLIRQSRRLPAVALLLLLVSTASAEETPTTYDRIHLSASASAEVENDILTAQLYVQRDGDAPAKLADEINREMDWALTTAKATQGVVVQTGTYRTTPRYRNQTLIGWQVRQDLALESRDAAALSQLIGQLQGRLAVQSMGYRVSETARQAVEERLITEALKNFQSRAKLVTGNLKRQDYRLVQLTIHTGQHTPGPVYRGAMIAEAAIAPPALEAGSQKLSVSIDGSIELLLR